MNLKTELPINQLNMHHESYLLYMGMVEAFSSFTKATRRGRSYVNTSDIFVQYRLKFRVRVKWISENNGASHAGMFQLAKKTLDPSSLCFG